MYILRKWYLDVLTADGIYIFLYFAYVRVAGYTMRSLVLHVAPGGSEDSLTIPLRVRSHEERSGGEREIVVSLHSGAIRIGREGCHVSATNSLASVDLDYTPITQGKYRAVRIEGQHGGHILWEPIGVRYRVEGRVLLNGSRIDIHESAGYADFLESTILPPRVPVRRLFWGRAHCPEGDLAFMHASGVAGGPSWSRLILHRQGRMEESDSVVITDPSGHWSGPAAMGIGHYVVRAPLTSGEFQMTVRHQKTVQKGSFVDQQRICLPLLGSLVKKVTRDPRGTKFLSCVDVPAWGASDLLMIAEEAHL
jgi:hypothetical protein